MKTSLFLLFMSAFLSSASFAQQITRQIPKQRPADYEYLSAPDSTGKRTALKIPSSLANTSQSGMTKAAYPPGNIELPYPIIFIHGFNSNGDTWNPTTDFMDANYGTTFGGRFDFCLNSDGNVSTANTNYYPAVNADLRLFSGTWQIGDYYYINFDVGSDGSVEPDHHSTNPYWVESEQSAAVKQGAALAEAIYAVLQLTGRDKVVLMCHSMGGLAAREYLQNSYNWQPDGKHHVAKLVTTGSPHGGTNVSPTILGQIATGADPQSEAIRDLRTFYYHSLDSGVYLFGGIELQDHDHMNDSYFSYFYNVDVNCNGFPVGECVGCTGDGIIGLNDKNIDQDSVDYSCIIGECTSCPFGQEQPGDGIINDAKANLNNYYSNITKNLFYYSAAASDFTQIHTDLPSQYYQNMQGLDEPNDFNIAYGVNFDTIYIGFNTIQNINSPYYPVDYDDYKFSVPSDGNVSVSINNIALSDLIAHIVDANYNTVGTLVHSNASTSINFTQTLNAGDYYLEIYGTPTSTSYESPYQFQLHLTPTSAACTPPSNNSCFSPNTLSIGAVCNYTSGDLCGATQEIPPSTCSGFTAPTALDVWYTITPSSSSITITCQGGINTDVVLGIYSGSCPNFTLIDCSDATVEGYAEILNETGLTPGATYFVRVYDYNGNASGTDFQICANYSGCISSSNINVSPISPILCKGQSVSLTASGSITYTWSPASGLSATSGSTVSANPSFTTTYLVTGTDISGCTSTKSMTVTVNQLPVINASPAFPIICKGQSVLLTASGGTTYTWSPSIGLSASTGSTVSSNPSFNTTYTVTGTDANGCSSTRSVTVKINQLPVITASPSSPIICNGQSVLLSAIGSATYAWSPSAGLSATTGTTVTATPSSTTAYTITGTDANGCSNTKSLTVIVNPLPVITASPFSPIICNGQSVSLTAGGGNTYTWSPTTGLSSGTGTTVSANPSSTTTYIVTGTDGNGCTNTKSETVTVNPFPVIAANPASPIICNGQSVVLTASGGVTYTWNPSIGLSSSTGTIVSANPSSTTTYTITGTDGNGCANTKSVTVTVNPLPIISASPAFPIICNGQPASLTASGAITYAWSPSAGLSATTGTTVTATPSSTTAYTITGTDANGCSNTKSLIVIVNPLPVITASPFSPIICNGQSVSLTAGGGNTYTWSPTTGLSSGTGTTVSANPSSTTTYIVTGTDGNGCTNTKSETVTVNPFPVIAANPASPIICYGQSVVLTASGGVTYTWNPSIGLSSSTGTIVSASPSSTTTYTITGTDGNGCTNSKSVMVSVNPLPIITASPTSPIICNGQSVSLTANGATTYAWSPSTGLSATTGTTVTANPSSTTTYIITGTDANGCSNTKSLTVTVNQLPVITANPASPIICKDQSVSLTAGGGITYTWSPTTGLSSAVGTTVSANPSSTTIYTITGTDGNGCSNTKSVIVTINQLPIITVNPASPIICNGQSVLLTATGGVTYIWNPTTGLSSGSGSTVSARPTSSISYIVTGTDGNGCTNTKSVMVTVNLIPNISINQSAGYIRHLRKIGY